MKYAPLLFIPLVWVPLRLGAQPCALDVSAGSSVTLSNTSVTYCSVVVSAGATLFINGAVTINVTGNVDIEGMVDGIGFGYWYTSIYVSQGPGAGGEGNVGAGGGGHGGAGGNGSENSSPSMGLGGPANDNPNNPLLMGSAGGSVVPAPGAYSPAFPGGAAFLLSAPSGTVTLNGVIDMSGRGFSGVFSLGSGGGAGGTISISAQAILFNGVLNANGGAGGANSGGGGGGLIFLCPSLTPVSGAGIPSVAGGAGGSANGFPVGGSPGAAGVYTVCPLVMPTPSINIFYVSCNAFNPSQASVSILVETNSYPGRFSLAIYNSAGEHIKTLVSQTLSNPITQSYSWDGTNKYGNTCASGVYILDLAEPLSHQQKRVLLIK
jgi:hypothetical protein